MEVPSAPAPSLDEAKAAAASASAAVSSAAAGASEEVFNAMHDLGLEAPVPAALGDAQAALGALAEGPAAAAAAAAAQKMSAEMLATFSKLKDTIETAIEKNSKGEPLGEEEMKQAMAAFEGLTALLVDVKETYGGELQDMIPHAEIEALQTAIEKQDFDSAIAAAHKVFDFAAKTVGKALALRDLVMKRLQSTEAQVTAALQKSAEDGLKDVVQLLREQGDMEAVTGYYPDDVGFDQVVTGTGEARLNLVKALNAAGFLFTPIYLAFLTTMVLLAILHPVHGPGTQNWHLIGYFIIQGSLELVGWLLLAYMESLTLGFLSFARAQRAQLSDHADAHAGESTSLLRKHTSGVAAAAKVEELIGLEALVVTDSIVDSCWYTLLQVLTPVKIGWGVYGLVIYYTGNTCRGDDYLAVLLKVYVFYFILTLQFSVLQFVLWAAGYVLQLSAVYNAILDACDKSDEKMGLQTPVAGPLFARVVMRNHKSTSKRLRRRKRANLEHEVKAAAARLAAAEGLLAAMGSAEDDVDDEEHPSVYWRGRRDAAAEAVAGVPEAEAPAGASFV